MGQTSSVNSFSVTDYISRKYRVYTVRVGEWKNLRTPETLVMEHWMKPEEESDLFTEYMFKLINRLRRCQEVAINKMEEMQIKRKTWSSGLSPKIYKSVLGNRCSVDGCVERKSEERGEIKWTTEGEDAFRELKGKQTDKPVLYAPIFEREFIVQTDASNAGMGAVSTQLNEQVMIDHNPLVWLNRNVSSNPRLMRWALALQPYNFRIVHQSGKSPKNADSLSRSVIDN
ncbi:retrovirus-related Pol polyprotein from transposon 17.6 [Trichonephila clavipes]|nr:retrovirus-related Pol polyprotein from transposon 17.6 [Trichonephila clavipes]